MIAQYRSDEKDASIINSITSVVSESLSKWYGIQSRPEAGEPEIHSYRNSFMLRYPIQVPGSQQKHILVKIRRNPKMTSLHQAVDADIHRNIPQEYHSLQKVYSHIGKGDEDLGAIRPLLYLKQYFAIIMEEYPSRTLRQLLNRQRSLHGSDSPYELSDAARKTGLWLHCFHHHVHSFTERPFTSEDILEEVKQYAKKIESNSHGRVRTHTILDAFAAKLRNIHVDRVAFSQSHTDMTCDNVLYSDDQRVCVIDIKTREAPVYADLGLILVHPETLRPQIFSVGTYYPESILQKYRSQILAGYFQEVPGNPVLAQAYTAVKVLDKWLMYEELMKRYKGVKHLLCLPVAPYISAYFHNLMKKHLGMLSFMAALMIDFDFILGTSI